MKKTSKDLSSAQIKGSSTELHVLISSPDLSKKDFEFAPPAGTTLKESLFSNLTQPRGIPYKIGE
jgi:hypothetical protein